MVRTSVTPKIVQINSLRRLNRKYDPVLAKRIRNGISKNGGVASVFIHPFALLDRDSRKDKIRYNDFIGQGYVTNNDYMKFLDRQKKAICSGAVPAFILADPHSESMFHRKLPQLKTNKVIVMCRTHYDNPIPAFSEADMKVSEQKISGSFSEIFRWTKLFIVLRSLGVKSLLLMGEFAFEEDDIKRGCVYGAKNALSPFFWPHKVSIDRSLTFPNIKAWSGRGMFT